MADEPSEIDIHAYIDGQLDIGRRFAIETHLSANPPRAAQVMGELSNRTAIQLLSADPGPASAAMRARAAPLGPSAAKPFRRRLAMAGGLSAVAALCGLLLIPDAPPAYVNIAVASHRVAALRAVMASQIEAPALDAREILASTNIDIPGLPDDWRITDVQLFPTARGPALLVAVKTVQGQHLSIFALRERSNAPEIPDAIREGAQSVAYWRRGEMSYALTGEQDPGTVDRTAEVLNRFWS